MPDLQDKSPAPDAPKSTPDAKADTQPEPKPEKRALLLKFEGDIPPGRIVRGAPERIDALIKAGKARAATEFDVGIAAGRVIGLR